MIEFLNKAPSVISALLANLWRRILNFLSPFHKSDERVVELTPLDFSPVSANEIFFAPEDLTPFYQPFSLIVNDLIIEPDIEIVGWRSHAVNHIQQTLPDASSMIQ